MAKQTKSARAAFLATIQSEQKGIGARQTNIIEALRTYADADCQADQEDGFWKALSGEIRTALEGTQTLSEGTCKTRASAMSGWLRQYATNATHGADSGKEAVGVPFREFQKGYSDFQRCLADWNRKKGGQNRPTGSREGEGEQATETVEFAKACKLAFFVQAVVDAGLADAPVFEWMAANAKESLTAVATYVLAKQNGTVQTPYQATDNGEVVQRTGTDG